jgi:DNA repair photolyase
MDTGKVQAIEPRAPAPEHRLRGLKEFNKAGVQTYVSMSPTYPTQTREDLREQLKLVADCDPDVVFHEPINPRGANFEMTVQAARDAGEIELADSLNALRDRETWRAYAVNHFRWVDQLGNELEIPIHLWPDKQLVKQTDGVISDWLESWRKRQSVESFAGRGRPEKDLISCPE